MATFAKFNCFTEDVAEKVHNLGSDTLKIYLTNTAPVATNTVYGTPADLSTTGGYTAGGATCTLVSSVQTSGVYKLVLTAPSWTGAGGGFGPFRYVILYNDTSTTDALIGYWDLAAAQTISAGITFAPSLSASNGTLTIT